MIESLIMGLIRSVRTANGASTGLSSIASVTQLRNALSRPLSVGFALQWVVTLRLDRKLSIGREQNMPAG